MFASTQLALGVVMREIDLDQPTTTKPRTESSPQEPTASNEAKRAQPRRTFDTLSEENPLICRGID